MGEPVRITKRVVDGLSPGETAWDAEFSGFGVRCQRRDKVYILKTRVSGRQRWFTIGRHGAPWTPETARREALSLLGSIARGDDPSTARERKTQSWTVKELIGLFLDEHVAPKRKPRTEVLYRDYLERLVLPRIGRRLVAEIKHADIARLHHEWRETPYQANRIIAVLSKMFSFAEERELIPEGSNPCRRIEKYREEARDRFLTQAEISRLGDALIEAEDRGSTSPHVIAAIRLLLFTGARLSEILTLRWEHVDLERSILFLPDSKTGRKAILLNSLACEVLSSLPRLAGNPWVIAGHKHGEHLVNLQKPWRAIRKRAGLEDVRIHDLRHTFASVAAASGASLPIIGKLLGHAQSATTERYAHLAADPVRLVGEQTGQRLAGAGKRPALIVEN
jgi:integrase